MRRSKREIIENLRGFEISMLPYTEHKQLRVKIKDLRFNKKKIIPYRYEFNNCKDEAIKYLKDLKIKCLYCCETEKGYIILTDNFEVMIK